MIALGVSHKTAPVSIREKLAFSPENVPLALETLTKMGGVNEVAILSTCNRTEFYCSVPASHNPVTEQMTQWWQAYREIPFDVRQYTYAFSGEAAVKHMMRLASGLDSMVLGEPQILGQLKLAYHTAAERGTLGKKLTHLFQRSFSIAKSVRYETEIGVNPVSVAYSAVTLAKQIFSDLSQSTVLLIGAGENIALTLQHLMAHNPKQILLANRSIDNAKALAARCQGEAFGLDNLIEPLKRADIVISSVDTQAPIVLATHLKAAFEHCKRRPLFMVDLGVPRNIHESVGEHDDVYLYTVDDLQHIVSKNLKHRENAALQAESMIETATKRYMNWILMQKQSAPIKQLRSDAHTIKEEMLLRALKRLEQGDDPKATLSTFAHQITQKLMHLPTVELRQQVLIPSEEE